MKILYILGMCCLTAILSNLTAQTHIWTGNGGDSDWFNVTNWDSGTLPIETSSVQIGGNFVVNISGNSAEAYTIDILNGATLQLESGLTTGSIITIYLNSTMEFISGTLSGSGIHNNGLLKLEGELSRTFDQTSVTNNALFLVTNSNQTQVLGTTINNTAAGTIDVASVGGVLQQGTSSILNNEGLLKKSPDGINPFGNFYLILEINNEGTIDVMEDQIFLLLAGSSIFTNFEQGRIIGNGTYDITATFINVGTVAPGNSSEIGALEITNNFSLNGGTIEIDIAGTQPNEFDLVAIFGSPVMDGFIDVNLQFAPQLNDEFTVVSWNLGGGSCVFPQFTTSVFEGLEYTFEITCNTNDVTLTVSDISILSVGDEHVEKFDFFVQPNPVSNEAVFIFSSELIPSEDTELLIYNYMGQQVHRTAAFTQENNVFHRGNRPGGLYFARLVTDGKVLATTRMVLE